MDNRLNVSTVALPAASRATRFYASPNLADAYAVPLPEAATRDPETLARFLFAQQAPWVGRMLGLRDAVVSVFGLKTTRDLQRATESPPVPRIAFFRIYEKDANEILLGEDDRHLDFRIAVRCEPDAASPGSRRLVVCTVVQCHNLLGRLYILAIAPWHRVIVRSGLRHAARAGWPARVDASTSGRSEPL
jgi:hypothetical protein